MIKKLCDAGLLGYNYIYILDGKNVVECPDLQTWFAWYESSSRSVANETIDGVRVSTVFLGLDHSFGTGPLTLFETMVFGGPLDGEQYRCATWEEAELMHAKAVSRLKEKVDKRGEYMGMYTEFHFNAPLIAKVDNDVIEILEHMISGGLNHCDVRHRAPSHKLFTEDFSRWSIMLTTGSYYFNSDTISTLRFDEIAKQYYLCIRCNLKNYTSEIENFIDWISPYIDAERNELLGYFRYEEDILPKLIFFNGVRCVEHRIEKLKPELILE